MAKLTYRLMINVTIIFIRMSFSILNPSNHTYSIICQMIETEIDVKLLSMNKSNKLHRSNINNILMKNDKSIFRS